MNHNFNNDDRPVYKDYKCIYCNISLKEYICTGTNNNIIFIEDFNKRPRCLTDEEYLIKSIIE